MSSRKKSKKWTWVISILALLVVLDLCALTWYLWSIPEDHFQSWKKIVSTIVSWIGSILTFFGIRHKFKREKSIEQVLKIRPVQLCIVAITIIIWYFILPFHSITMYVKEFDFQTPVSGVGVMVDDEEGYRGFSDENGKVKIGSINVGAHKFLLEKSGYKPKSVTPSILKIVSFWTVSQVQLEKAVGTRKLNSIPEGAEIFLDGDINKAIGTTPKTHTLSVGKHTIMFKKAGFYPTKWEDISISIGVNPPFERKLKERKPTYTLTVDSDPKGAQIYVNGVLMGVTLDTIELTKGVYEIEARKSKYEPAKRVIELPGRDYINFPLTLKKDKITIQR